MIICAGFFFFKLSKFEAMKIRESVFKVKLLKQLDILPMRSTDLPNSFNPRLIQEQNERTNKNKANGDTEKYNNRKQPQKKNRKQSKTAEEIKSLRSHSF